ncbi:amino acid ABC transporter substrate-binding protein, partial [bacterium]
MKRIKAVFLILVTTALIASGCSKESGKTENTIKLGFISPLTGDLAYIGENMKAAVEIAQAELNTSGGVTGKRIEIIFEDG